MKKSILKKFAALSFTLLFSFISISLYAGPTDGWVLEKTMCADAEGIEWEAVICDAWGGNCNDQFCCDEVPLGWKLN